MRIESKAINIPTKIFLIKTKARDFELKLLRSTVGRDLPPLIKDEIVDLEDINTIKNGKGYLQKERKG